MLVKVMSSNKFTIIVCLQMVDLTAARGPEYLLISAKAKREILSAVQQAVSKKFSNSAERRFITELAMTLHHLWSKIMPFHFDPFFPFHVINHCINMLHPFYLSFPF